MPLLGLWTANVHYRCAKSGSAEITNTLMHIGKWKRCCRWLDGLHACCRWSVYLSTCATPFRTKMQ